jgi:hypothetical protein
MGAASMMMFLMADENWAFRTPALKPVDVGYYFGCLAHGLHGQALHHKPLSAVI